MIKYVVHIADVHIRTFRLHDEYRETLNTFIEQLKISLKDIDGTNEFNPNQVRIAIVGDLVHQKIVISNEQLMLGTWLLKELEKIAPVIIIGGNHDLLENNKDRLDSITPMVKFLSDKNINYFKESKCYLDGNIVWCVYSIFDNNDRPDIETARIEYGEDKTYIGLFHAPIQNAKTDTGYEIDHGADFEIFEGCDFVLLGDIHKRQEFNYKGIKLAYPGSLIQQNFGETVSKHGFLIWNVKEKNYTEYNVTNDYSMYTIKIKSVEDLENNKEVITNL